MNKQEAVNILTQATAEMKGTRQEHLMVMEALKVITQDVINPVLPIKPAIPQKPVLTPKVKP
jgi:hypothetical protein